MRNPLVTTLKVTTLKATALKAKRLTVTSCIASARIARCNLITLCLLPLSFTWLNLAHAQLLYESSAVEENTAEQNISEFFSPFKQARFQEERTTLNPISDRPEKLNENDSSISTSGTSSAETEGSQTDTEKFQQELAHWRFFALTGDADAQFKVAALYTNTKYQQPNLNQAIHFYTLAADQNHALAQYNLGHHYLNGIGVSKNIESAVHLWLKAAQQDHPLAQFNVGRAYYLGIGLPVDLTQARHWFEQAAANNETKSIELLKQVNWDELVDAESSDTTTEEQERQLLTAKNESEPDNDNSGSASVLTGSAVNTEETSNEQAAQANTPKKLAVTLYTNPGINHYPISIVEDSSDLEIIKQSKEWTTVKYSDSFPVWVHADFVAVTGSQALVTSSNINTRTKPLIIHGNIVGKLNVGETVEVLDSTERWHQIIAPSHFQAWVKTSQLSLSTYIEQVNDNQWLFKQDPKHYTLELASFDDTDDVKTFLNKSKLKTDINTHQFDSKKAQSKLTFFLYGTYKEKADALKAKLGIVDQGALVKSFASIQQNRCVNWKKQLPPPTELNTYCAPSQ